MWLSETAASYLFPPSIADCQLAIANLVLRRNPAISNYKSPLEEAAFALSYDFTTKMTLQSRA